MPSQRMQWVSRADAEADLHCLQPLAHFHQRDRNP